MDVDALRIVPDPPLCTIVRGSSGGAVLKSDLPPKQLAMVLAACLQQVVGAIQESTIAMPGRAGDSGT